MGKSTISMAIFNSYVSSPEGTTLYAMLCMLGNVSCPPASNMAIENPKSRFACIMEAFPTQFCTWWFKLWLIYHYVVKAIWNLQVGMLYAVHVVALPQYLPSGLPLASSVTSFLPSFLFNRWRACLYHHFAYCNGHVRGIYHFWYRPIRFWSPVCWWNRMKSQYIHFFDGYVDSIILPSGYLT